MREGGGRAFREKWGWGRNIFLEVGEQCFKGGGEGTRKGGDVEVMHG